MLLYVYVFLFVFRNSEIIFAQHQNEEEDFSSASRFPHTVAFIYKPELDYFCGGSVLNENYILSAASCLAKNHSKNDNISEQYYILAGGSKNNVQDDSAEIEAQVIKYIKEVHIADCYNQNTGQDDIMVAALTEPLNLTGVYIKPVHINFEFPDDRYAVASGWKSYFEQDAPEITKIMARMIHRDRTCCKIFHRTTPSVKWHSGLICAGNLSAEYQMHQGTAGDPLTVGRTDQIGVYAYQMPNKVDIEVYTKVSHYYDWIVQISKLNESESYK